MQWLTSHEVSILLWEEWGNHWQQLFISLFSNIEPSCLWTSVYEALAPQTKSEILLLVVVVEEDAQASSPFLDLLWNSLPPKKELPRLNEGYNFRIPFGNEMMWQWPSLLFPQATGGSLDFAVDDRRPCLILVRWLSCGMMVGRLRRILPRKPINRWSRHLALFSYSLRLIGTNTSFGFEHKTRREITEPSSLIQLCCWLFLNQRNVPWTHLYLKYTNSSRSSAGTSGKQIGQRFVQPIDYIINFVPVS